MAEALIDTRSLNWLCRAVHFEAGDILRHKGQHYRDTYLLVQGSVAVHRPRKGREELVVADCGFEPEPSARMFLLPKNGMPMQVRLRQKTASGPIASAGRRSQLSCSEKYAADANELEARCVAVRHSGETHAARCSK